MTSEQPAAKVSAARAQVPFRASSTLALWLGVLALVYLLLVGVSTIGEGFKWISGGAEGAAAIFAFANNPIVGVILGTLATALVQSSSTVTSVIVGLVAGGVPVAVAVPMIMGANMGTTITNTIVSLGSLRERAAFGRSFEAATVHDFFNLYSIVLFLPLEIAFHPLENAAALLATMMTGGPEASLGAFNPTAALTRPVSHFIAGLFAPLPSIIGALTTIALGILMVIASVLALGTRLRSAMTGRAKGFIDTAIGRGPAAGIASGALVTVLVQSSSTTTSLVVPLAGAGVLSTRQIYPFTLGANIGTCVTALLAATAVTGIYEFFALQIALVHLLYNGLGVVLFTTMPLLRELPINSSRWLAGLVQQHRGWAFAYIGSVFFVLPGVVLGMEILRPGDGAVDQALTRACDPEIRQCVVDDIEALDMHLE